MTTVPEDVRLARAIRALRDSVLLGGGGSLALAVMAAAILALAGPDADLGWATLTILGGAQLLGLVGALLAGLGLRTALRTATPEGADGAVARTRDRLRLLTRVLLVWCVSTAAGWTLAVPSRLVITLALAAVAAQLAVLLQLAARRLDDALLD